MAIDDGRVVSNFIVQTINNHPITIYGNGTQTRSFCYVDDMVEGLIKMMNHNTATGPINLGNPSEVSIIKIANEILEICNSKSEIIKLDKLEDDPAKENPILAKQSKS